MVCKTYQKVICFVKHNEVIILAKLKMLVRMKVKIINL